MLMALRMVKAADEIAALQHAQGIVNTAYERIRHSRFAGRSELSIQQEPSELRKELGLDEGTGGIVGSGPDQSASPHHRTGEHVIEAGDAVVLDFGGTYQGYHADITRTVHVGPPPAEVPHSIRHLPRGAPGGLPRLPGWRDLREHRPGGATRDRPGGLRPVLHAPTRARHRAGRARAAVPGWRQHAAAGRGHDV